MQGSALAGFAVFSLLKIQIRNEKMDHTNPLTYMVLLKKLKPSMMLTGISVQIISWFQFLSAIQGTFNLILDFFT